MKTYRLGNVIVKVYRPDLTSTERSKRERELAISLEQFGKEMYKAQKERKPWQH
jgi:hypothetical protein